MTTSQIGNDRGFTYIEVMLSVLIFSLGYIAIASSYSKVVDAFNASENNIQAMVLLNDKIAQLQENSIKEGGLEPQNQSGTFAGRLKKFKWVLDIDAKNDTPNINQVKLEVSWGGPLRRGMVDAITYMERKLNKPALP